MFMTNLKSFNLVRYMLLDAVQKYGKIETLLSNTKKAEEIAEARLKARRDAFANALALIGTEIRAEYVREQLGEDYDGTISMVDSHHVDNWMNRLYERHAEVKATEDNKTKESREQTKVDWNHWWDGEVVDIVAQVFKSAEFTERISLQRQEMVLNGLITPTADDLPWLNDRLAESKKALSPLEQLIDKVEI